ncbi:hypothetical protein [Zhongshania sp.]|jgi:hypothetical protein|uniref:hypothetical protein n=1 Tax=Zhongshania sp. TaxID=1971902 RepID=UPI0039E38CEC
MNKTISAILILLASAMATAAEPNTAATEPMVIAYNQIEDSKLQEPTAKLTSKHLAARFLEKNLDVVAASLNLELDDKISSAMTPRFDQ